MDKPPSGSYQKSSVREREGTKMVSLSSCSLIRTGDSRYMANLKPVPLPEAPGKKRGLLHRKSGGRRQFLYILHIVLSGGGGQPRTVSLLQSLGT